MTDKQMKKVFKNGFYCIEPCLEIKQLLAELKRKEQECEQLREIMHKDICSHYVLGECSQKHHNNCVGRNRCIQDLEQECEGLKIYIESNEQQVKEVETLVMDNDRLINELDQLKQALEEIKDATEQAKKHEFVNMTDYWNYILTKCEVLDED